MKLFIFGIVASGKTTLAKKLSEKYKIPYYEGDCIAWVDDKNNRHKRTILEQQEIIEQINLHNDWIIEGTYRESQKILFDLADKVIFLDPPLWLRKKRIFIRYLKQKLGIEKSHYQSNLKMLKMMYKWTNDFEKERDKYETLINNYHNKIIHIKYGKEIDNQPNIFKNIS